MEGDLGRVVGKRGQLGLPADPVTRVKVKRWGKDGNLILGGGIHLGKGMSC
jgi:hypothetical protein